LTPLATAYADGSLTVSALVDAVVAGIAAAGEDHVWIHRVPDAALRARAAELDAKRRADVGITDQLPLFGIPFAVKDNIDVAGLPTTAACPAFAYTPARSASAVDRLLAAGAVLIGKTNLDQFATGLVGTRSPYGAVRNPFDARYISGGSSSGSAVAVAAGLVSFALGTDTAGSGRVPAAFNNIAGLKPTRGLISAAGVVPACRSLDCVSIFAFSAADAARVLEVAAGYDPRDPFSRPAAAMTTAFPPRFRFGVPAARDLVFFGNAEVEALYHRALDSLEALGGTRVEIDFSPFREAAALLYSGPWVAERFAAVEELFTRAPEALLPVTRDIIGAGARPSAVEAFRGLYRLAELRQRTQPMWREMDVMVLPTAGTIYTLAEIAAEPVRLNSNLGAYTNFVNLLDLAAHAIPCGFQPDGLPAGITLIAPAFTDWALARLAQNFQRRLDLPLGAVGERLAPGDVQALVVATDGLIPLAVVGAHMRGLPLNRELTDLGASFVETVRTGTGYRLFTLGGSPERPGMVRVGASEGAAIEAEIWSLTPASLGAFVARIAPPLCIGTIELDDGRTVKGFLCESVATAGKRDITGFGGWRSYLG
jgi:allophanate hydrolase